jgi:hypothetical protein
MANAVFLHLAHYAEPRDVLLRANQRLGSPAPAKKKAGLSPKTFFVAERRFLVKTLEAVEEAGV